MTTHLTAALFDEYAAAEHAIGELEAAGVPSDDISIVAHGPGSPALQYPEHRPIGHEKEGAESGAAVGAVVAGSAGLLAGIGAIAIPGIGPLIAAGALATTLAGATIGGSVGGIIGALVGAGIPREQADIYLEALRRGGTLVAVRADDTRRQRVAAILAAHRPIDIEQRAAAWGTAGWTRSEPAPVTEAGARSSEPERSAPVPMPTGSGALDTTPRDEDQR